MKVVMDTNATFTKELATAFVMTKRFELNNIQAWLYNQVGPKGMKKKIAQGVDDDQID